EPVYSARVTVACGVADRALPSRTAASTLSESTAMAAMAVERLTRGNLAPPRRSGACPTAVPVAPPEIARRGAALRPAPRFYRCATSAPRPLRQPRCSPAGIRPGTPTDQTPGGAPR